MISQQFAIPHSGNSIAVPAARIAAGTCALAFVAAFAGASLAQESPGTRSAVPADVSQPTASQPIAGAAEGQSAGAIAALIRQLDADSYVARQEATRRLAQSGVAAAQPLAAAAVGDNLEIAIRALDALRLLGRSDDPGTQEASFEALERLATADDRAVNTRAKNALAELRKYASKRAIEMLKERGAEFVDARRNDGEITPVGGGVIMLGGRFSSTSIYLPGWTVLINEKWTGKAADLKLLNRIDNLSLLVFDGPKIDDDYLAQLRATGTSPVMQLAMHSCKVTDRGIANLASFSSLVSLEITQIPMTDASLSTIGKLSNLKSIRLFGTKVTAAGAKELATALPQATVDRRGGALLGVSGSIGDTMCLINTVREGSAAAKAGILEGDVVMKFAGTEVHSFTELTAAIADKAGGDKVEIEIARSDAAGKTQVRKVMVTLGSW